MDVHEHLERSGGGEWRALEKETNDIIANRLRRRHIQMEGKTERDGNLPCGGGAADEEQARRGRTNSGAPVMDGNEYS